MGFSRQKYWSGLSCLPPEDLPEPGIKLASLTASTLAGRFFTLVPPGKPSVTIYHANKKSLCEFVTIHPWLRPSLPYFLRIQIYLVSTHQLQLPSQPLGSVWPPASPLFQPPLAAHRLHARPRHHWDDWQRPCPAIQQKRQVMLEIIMIRGSCREESQSLEKSAADTQPGRDCLVGGKGGKPSPGGSL